MSPARVEREQRGPTFLIAGAPRSGTTWLYHLLDRHPEVFMARPTRPEPKFFLVEELFARGLDYYVKTWFDGSHLFKAAGEKTTNYLENLHVAGRIHQRMPDVQLVFILRDPVDRAFSNWAWSRMNGMETEDFETALSLESERERQVPDALRYARPHAYFSRGLYAQLLTPFFELFPREQILCLNFDDILTRPGELASHLHRWLGVDPRPGDAAGLDVINPSESTGETLLPDARARLRARYAEPGRALVQMLGPEFCWD